MLKNSQKAPSAKMIYALLDDAGADWKTVAEIAGVNQSSVSRAINGERNGKSSEFTRGVIAGLIRKRKSELWPEEDAPKAEEASKAA